ncbi:unnamed protein product [Phytomonas sp. EM1]|nr:unnamed protein product [Phytomonas sp. EM1]|eukprot:CCW62112.1 unnamed protein product [Phytomonas sp. isolate EM1]
MPPKNKGPAESSSNESGYNKTGKTALPSAGGSASASAGIPQSGSAELGAYMQELLQRMQSSFENMSKQIAGRIDEMDERVGVLEKSIDELIQQAGAEPGAPDPVKKKK